MLNGALTLRLAAEFQGFAHELHDLGSETFAAWTAPDNPGLERVVRSRLTSARDIDRGNAHPGSLGADFGRFGFDLWPALRTKDPGSDQQRRSLEQLNEVRNAVAHANEAKLSDLGRNGMSMTLDTFRGWRRDLDRLARNPDGELADQIGRIFGKAAPW